MFSSEDSDQMKNVMVPAVLSENCPRVGSTMCRNLSSAMAQSDQLVTKTAQELDSGTRRHITAPNDQSLVSAYQGVTGTAVRQRRMSVSMRFSRKRFRVERRLEKFEELENFKSLQTVCSAQTPTTLSHCQAGQE